MNNTTKPTLVPAFNTYTDRTYPGRIQAKAVWGARLIAPNDLVYNRQDLVAESDEDKQKLMHWLNPEGGKAIERLLNTNPYAKGLAPNSQASAVLVEDDEGIIVGSCQASYGYLYCTGWLK